LGQSKLLPSDYFFVLLHFSKTNNILSVFAARSTASVSYSFDTFRTDTFSFSCQQFVNGFIIFHLYNQKLNYRAKNIKQPAIEWFYMSIYLINKRLKNLMMPLRILTAD